MLCLCMLIPSLIRKEAFASVLKGCIQLIVFSNSLQQSFWSTDVSYFYASLNVHYQRYVYSFAGIHDYVISSVHNSTYCFQFPSLVSWRNIDKQIKQQYSLSTCKLNYNL